MTYQNQRKSSELCVAIAPFTGNLHVLARMAAKELEKGGFCKMIEIDQPGAHRYDSYDILLIEDGYTSTLYKDLPKEQQGYIAHHLILKDIGLEEDAEIDEDNIGLVKDAIEAESVVVDSYTPKFNCPCCGNL